MDQGSRDIRFERRGGLGLVVLDRQSALNALTPGMVRALSLQLLAWRDDPAVAVVLVKAAPGRAFCAGGDVRGVSDAGQAGRTDEVAAFFREEYRLNWRIRRHPKPYVAFLDGIVMGGGVGISVHGSHRVVTENTLFAMPETGLGLFPDVGATHVLPRCPGEVGTYLGLTGERLRAADCRHAGIGTHHVPAGRLDGLEDALASVAADEGGRDEVGEVVARFATEAGEAPLAGLRGSIDTCFAGDSLPEIVAALEREEGDFGREVLAGLRNKSPLSLHVTLAQLRRGAGLTFEEAMRLEFRLARHLTAPGSDFHEGVRALLIDKDKRPRWRHPDLGSVTAGEVAACFAPAPDGDELALDWQGP